MFYEKYLYATLFPKTQWSGTVTKPKHVCAFSNSSQVLLSSNTLFTLGSKVSIGTLV